MNQIEDEGQPEEEERGDELQQGNGDAPPGATPPQPVVDPLQAVAADVHRRNPEERRDDEQRNRYQRFCRWLRRSSLTDVLIAIFTGLLLVVAWRQTGLESQANTISGRAAAAAESASNVAKQALDMAEAGEATTKQIADSLRKTAQANEASANIALTSAQIATKALQVSEENKETGKNVAKSLSDTAYWSYFSANATKAVATENAKSAAATQDAVKVSAAALAVANTAKEFAGRAAQAAEDAVKLARENAISDMRAYLSVIGTDLRLDESTRQLVATITVENTGKTPAHHVGLRWEFTCQPSARAMLLLLPDALTTAEHSVGPRARFAYRQTWKMGDDVTQQITQKQMIAWIYGHVEFSDEFTDDIHFTNFRFNQGKRISGTTQWEMIFAESGNDSDRPRDRLLNQQRMLELPLGTDDGR